MLMTYRPPLVLSVMNVHMLDCKSKDHLIRQLALTLGYNRSVGNTAKKCDYTARRYIYTKILYLIHRSQSTSLFCRRCSKDTPPILLSIVRLLSHCLSHYLSSISHLTVYSLSCRLSHQLPLRSLCGVYRMIKILN